MRIAVVKETKEKENRVAATPAVVAELAARHEVLVETGAGAGSGFSDDDYWRDGARIVSTAEAWAADLVVKVKEPQDFEYKYLRPGLILFTYLHLAAEAELAMALCETETIAVGYETVQTPEGRLPLLEPMSEIAGLLAVQQGAHYLETILGGRGILLPGVPGVARAKVTIIGAGTVGASAARMAAWMQADVSLLDLNVDRLRYLETILPPNVKTLQSQPHTIAELLPNTDLLIGAVLVPGGRAPVVVDRKMLSTMPKGAVVVDVAIDQGGCLETSTATTHDDPIRIVEGVIHYCVTNMPAAVARTSTLALTNATSRYLIALADRGVDGAIARHPELKHGVNVRGGKITHPAVARALNEPLAA